MKLIVGLGNPGREYAATRHNVGWMALDHIAASAHEAATPWKLNKKIQGEIATSALYGAILLKPHTFMNESGRAVQSAARWYRVEHEDIWILHDDLDLTFGAYKIQQGRGAAGHHGVESVFEYLNTKQVHRIRIGIRGGIQRNANDGARFVLARFTAEESKQLPQLFSEITRDLLKHISIA